MSDEANTIQMKCQDCGGTLTVDKTRSILSCPYCGSTKMIAESDEVKMERIRTEANRDVEIERIQSRERQDRKDKMAILIATGCALLLMWGIVIVMHFLSA